MISDQDVDYDGNDDSEEYDYPVLSYDNIDGDDDSDACDYLVLSDDDVDYDGNDDIEEYDYLVISAMMLIMMMMTLRNVTTL